ncbi:MAG: pyrroline-5-carboxylate reductase [Candidatus Omnitrophota bacterium]
MKRIGLIGCGNMGEAILSGIISNRLVRPSDIIVSDADSAKLERVKKALKVDVTFNNSVVAKSSEAIILAVKPQDVEAVLLDVAEFLSKERPIISIAAGVTIKKIVSIIGDNKPVIRVMPNMPAIIKEGFSAISFSKDAGKREMDLAKKIFSCLGEAVEVKEKDLDAITAISGSGPAYFFYIVENLIKTGISMGLTRDTARRAAIKTAAGSCELMKRSSKEPSLLRKKVTSKGGTTEAAFRVFDKEGLGRIMSDGVKAAKKRSKELSGG